MNWQQQVDEFKKGLQPVAPSLSTVRICFGFFGSVGGGKSVTAGIFAVGITPTGTICWIDGEGGRSGYAIDQVADMAVKKYGGSKAEWLARFKVIHIDPPFNPLRVVAAIETAEEMGCKTVVLDVMSQCWDSEGGYLDLKDEKLYKMAGEDEAKRQRSSAAAAGAIKPWTHQKLVNKVNCSSSNLILLFQAKARFNAKISKPDDFVTPIQESGLTRTAIAVGRVEAKMVGEHPQGGFCTFSGAIEQGTKFTHQTILGLLPKNGEQMRFEHAEALAKWCAASGGNVGVKPACTPSVPPPASSAEAELKTEIWNLTAEHHQKSRAKLTDYLIRQSLIEPEDSFDKLSTNHLRTILAKLKSAEPDDVPTP